MNLNLHQGWSIAFVLFLCFTITVGVLQYSFGVFVTPLENAFGWTRTEINGSVALLSFTGIAGLVAGPLLDKYGSKPVMVFSVILLGISFVFRPFITELWHYYFLVASNRYSAFRLPFRFPSFAGSVNWHSQSRSNY